LAKTRFWKIENRNGKEKLENRVSKKRKLKKAAELAAIFVFGFTNDSEKPPD